MGECGNGVEKGRWSRLFTDEVLTIRGKLALKGGFHGSGGWDTLYRGFAVL